MIDPSVVRRRLRKLDELLQRLRELADRLADAAGQRNILVHLYLEVDPERVYETLTGDLDALTAFAERIERLL